MCVSIADAIDPLELGHLMAELFVRAFVTAGVDVATAGDAATAM